MIAFEREVRAFGHEQLLRISNDHVELFVATTFGIRVLGYALRGRDNIFGLLHRENPTSFGAAWRLSGGHRLWSAPEDPISTYWPDNAPIAVDIAGTAVTLTQPIEPPTGVEKSMVIRLDEASSHVVVRHRLVNRGGAAITLAPWALTVMRPGGQAILWNPPFVPHPVGLLPRRSLVVWPYTNLADPRFLLGPRLTRVRQDSTRRTPQKIGCRDESGAVAYSVDDQLFIKRHSPAAGAHADLDSNVEVFVDGEMVELETLGPLARLAPGEAADHVEDWHLVEAILPNDDDEDLAQALEVHLALTDPISASRQLP